MAYDEQHDDGLGGRSRRRREVTETGRWAAELVALPAWHRRAIPMTDELRAAIELGTTITSHIARKRHLGYIDGLIRLLDDEGLAALRRAIDAPPNDADPDVATRAWCARLNDEGERGIDAFVAAFPECERKQLRQLVRQGRPATLERYVRDAVEPK